MRRDRKEAEEEEGEEEQKDREDACEFVERFISRC